MPFTTHIFFEIYEKKLLRIHPKVGPFGILWQGIYDMVLSLEYPKTEFSSVKSAQLTRFIWSECSQRCALVREWCVREHLKNWKITSNHGKAREEGGLAVCSIRLILRRRRSERQLDRTRSRRSIRRPARLRIACSRAQHMEGRGARQRQLAC